MTLNGPYTIDHKNRWTSKQWLPNLNASLCLLFVLLTVPRLQMKFSVNNMCPIEGEGNVARFLSRLVGLEPRDPAAATMSDSWVDTAFFQLAEGSAKERGAVLRSLNGALGRGPWLTGAELSLADVVCACCLLKTGTTASSAPANVQRWLNGCQNLGHLSCIGPLL